MTCASLNFPCMNLVVGFDLDMTLLDTRAGIAATFRAFTERTGVWVDADLAVSRLGPPLATEMAYWAPLTDVPTLVEEYRLLYPTHAIAPTVPLPGAVAAVEAVRAAGGQVAVVTSKLARLAALHLEHAGIVADHVFGDVYAEGKAPALRSVGAAIYVGDHVADVRAGRAAGAVPVGVTTGPCSRDELLAAGADVVLDSLVEFPGALRRGSEPDLGWTDARG
jgi:phosphoglycolate phosphatase